MSLKNLFLRNKKTPTASEGDVPQASAPLPEKPAENISARTNAGILASFKSGLKKTKDGFFSKVGNLFLGKKTIDASVLKDLEALLLTADVGVAVTEEVIATLQKKLERRELKDAEVLLANLRTVLLEIIAPRNLPLDIDANNQSRPYVILLVGVNGSGKTTTIGKLTKQFQEAGKKVLLAAGDTFRAAAIEQLKVWGERNNTAVISQKPGADSAAVAFDALQAAKARNLDVLIVDTAGRLHTQTNLMEELKKVKRTLQKIDATAPHEVLLVLDATLGQNALNQARQFNEAVGVTGLCITKLDGTAKGGVIFAIAKELNIPIRFIGVGEGISDLKPFNAENFIEALFAAK